MSRPGEREPTAGISYAIAERIRSPSGALGACPANQGTGPASDPGCPDNGADNVRSHRATAQKEPRREGRALPVAYPALVPYTHKPYGDAGESFRGLTMLRTGAGPVTTRSAPRPEGTKSSTVTVARHDK